MSIRPTDVVEILRTSRSDPDEMGDAVSVDEVIDRVTASITEISSRVFDPDDQRLTIAELVIGRIDPDVDVQERDRLVTRDGISYEVLSVSSPSSSVRRPSQRLELRRIR